MLNAKDVMTRDVICISPETTLKDTVKVLVDNKVSGMPVCDSQGAVVGVISERDILNFIFSGNVDNTTVREAMSTNVLSFPSDTPIDKISLAMGEKQIRRVPIIDSGKLVGIISRRSILRTVLNLPKGQHHL
jgi:CBS domain-containing protein